MHKKRGHAALLGVLFLGLAGAHRADASLTVFQQFNGNVGLSTDGWGSLSSSSGTISASVPAGSTVIAAYLYSSYTNGSDANYLAAGVTLNGTSVSLGNPVDNATACCNLAMRRADVTSIVAPVINGGAGGVYNFTVAEGSTSIQDGEALVVVYSNAALGVGSVGILDGFAAVSGDTTSINFLNPLNPSASGFQAEMRLGIGYSCCSQSSTVTVNGTTITTNAGNNDDGLEQSNGSLITVGGYDDPFSPLNPTYAQDHERYDLRGQIAQGSTSITVTTSNTSHDDNIFLAAFLVSGEAGFNSPPPSSDAPEPSSYALMGGGLLAMLAYRRHRAKQIAL